MVLRPFHDQRGEQQPPLQAAQRLRHVERARRNRRAPPRRRRSRPRRRRRWRRCAAGSPPRCRARRGKHRAPAAPRAGSADRASRVASASGSAPGAKPSHQPAVEQGLDQRRQERRGGRNGEDARRIRHAGMIHGRLGSTDNNQAALSMMAASASATASGVPTCIQMPSMRRPMQAALFGGAVEQHRQRKRALGCVLEQRRRRAAPRWHRRRAPLRARAGGAGGRRRSWRNRRGAS